jgi:hypothetical protein
MWHLYDDLTRAWSAPVRDCAANICHDIEWDDRRWNGCAYSPLSYGGAESTCFAADIAPERFTPSLGDSNDLILPCR